jgi:hypothetical protein
LKLESEDDENLRGYKMEVLENKYRQMIADKFESDYLGTEKGELIIKAAVGRNVNPTLDYYIGCEKILNNILTVYETYTDIKKVGFQESGYSFVLMLGFISYEIIRLSKDKSKVEDSKMFG